VNIAYPAAAEVIDVVSTEEMLEASRAVFSRCQGLIGVAAPCDYRPIRVASGKIVKTGEPLDVHLIETPDIVATLGAEKAGQWLVGFALETDDHRLRALAKMQKKCCDLMVVNGTEAMHALDTDVEIIDRRGELIERAAGTKIDVSRRILAVIQARLMARPLDVSREKKTAEDAKDHRGKSQE
jgi:phosphopantothenoylcysteine decarboxylase/phosphopantothenate--cysteine ligase